MFLGHSRQAWYQHKTRASKQRVREAQIVDFVKTLRMRQARIGTRKLLYLINKQGESGLYIGRDRLFSLLKKCRLLVHSDLRTENVVQALEQALKTRKTTEPLIHYSDRGIQYCSASYQSVHARHGLICSMTDGYDCYHNALAERVNGILKTEFLLSRRADLEQARKRVKESIEIYNRERPHQSLKSKTPDEVDQALLG